MAIGNLTEGVNIPMVRIPIMGDDNDPKKTCLDCRKHPVFGHYCTGTVSSPTMTPWYFRISQRIWRLAVNVPFNQFGDAWGSGMSNAVCEVRWLSESTAGSDHIPPNGA